MPLKLINPYYVDSIEAKAQQHKNAVQSWLSTNTSVRDVTMEELRAALPSISADLSRQVVSQIARLINARLEER